MLKQKLSIFILLVPLLLPLQAFADVATSTGSSTAPTVLGVHTALVPPIITQITQAKALLASITLNHELIATYKNVKNNKTGKITKVTTKYTLGNKDIALAVMDPFSNNIITTVGRQNGTTMVFPDPAVDIQLSHFNGVNSQFSVNKPAGGKLLALKYLINKTDSGSKSAIENGLSPAVYVPYSDNLSSPDVIAYGQSYLDGVISTVAMQLQNLPSSAIPGETITQAVPPPMIKALVYAEHSDTASLLAGNARNLLNQMNLLLALNGPDTYKYSVSNDGYASRGIAQFVQSTYQSLIQRHPGVGLNPNYVAAMEDHVTSIKAMYLLLDDYAGAVRIKAPNGFVASRVFDYGAASYNGGTSRVANAVQEFGDSWSQDRSGQISGLQNDAANLSYKVKTLKAQIKKVIDKKTKASLQSQLAQTQNQLANDNSQISDLQSATLRNGTINYLAKIYKVVGYFNDQQVAYNR